MRLDFHSDVFEPTDKPDVIIKESLTINNYVELFIVTRNKQGNSNDYSLICDMTITDIESIRNNIRSIYLQIAYKIESQQIKSFSDLNSEYLSLVNKGNFLRNKFIGDTEAWGDLFEEMDGEPGLMEIKSQHFQIPYEFISDLDYYDLHNLHKAFLGTRYIINRKYIGKNIDFKRNKGYRPSISCACHSGLPGVKDIEMPFFESCVKRNVIQLFDCLSEENRKRGKFYDIINSTDSQIVHFACHIEQNKNDHTDAFLNFGNETLSITDIASISKGIAGKMIFINGCKSTNESIANSINFTKEFLSNGAASVVSVDIDIPDKFASKFSSMFYKSVFESRLNKKIDKIIYETYMDMFSNQKDIGGFFYSVYGRTKLN